MHGISNDSALSNIDGLHKSHGLCFEGTEPPGERYIIMYSQPRIGLPSLSVFVHDELFTFKSLQFVSAVEIFKWVTSPNIHFVQKGHLPLYSAHYSHRPEKRIPA